MSNQKVKFKDQRGGFLCISVKDGEVISIGDSVIHVTKSGRYIRLFINDPSKSPVLRHKPTVEKFGITFVSDTDASGDQLL